MSLGAEDGGLHLGAAAAPPAVGGDAHAALRPPRPVAVSALQPLAVRLALSAFGPAVDAARRGAGGWLRGDGAQQVLPLSQEVAVSAQAEASLTQHHARRAGLSGSRAVAVLQLG